MATLYCSFNLSVGWRVCFSKPTTQNTIGVVVEKGVKYLQIPSISVVRGGRFCNPVKEVFAYRRPIWRNQ